ncbi:MAG: NAD(P)-dependent oxidoreductase [Hyphomicrobiales bacterium]|nr:NAD(P)-dependent oxidoreductase [Hyphomicrobiales bacterium]
MATAPALGFVGLGVMGEPICRNILKANPGPTTVFDLNPDPVARLAADGAKVADDLAQVAAAADIIFLSLPGGPEVEATVLGPGGLLAHGRAGQTVVDLSTCPVATARRVAERLAEKGIDFADAPVARTRQAAIDGTLSIMVGGDDTTFARLRPLLAAAATDITHCGGVGTGQVVKLVNNMILFQVVVAVAEGLTIGERAGVDRQLLAETLAKGSGDSFALRNHGMKAMVPRTFPVGAFATDYAIKDVTYALELAAQCGVQAYGAALAKAILERTSAAGFGREYFPVLQRIVEGDGPDT